MSKIRILSLAVALAAAVSIHGARAADDYTETEPVEKNHLRLADGCIDVWATTSQPDAVAYGDPIPVRLLWVLKPMSMCQKKSADVSLLPPSAVSAEVAPATPAGAAANKPDVAKVLMPVPLDVPEINLQTIKSGQLTTSPTDVVTLKVGATGEQLLDPVCGPQCGKMVVQDIVVTQRITMQIVPPKPDGSGTPAKPDEKKPPRYKKRATIIMDFDYALFKQPGDNQPAWRTEHTPPLVVAIRQTAGIADLDPAASETLLREGDLSEKFSPLPPATLWFAAIAGFLALPMLADWLMTGVWFARRERVLSVNEKIWLVIDGAVREGEMAEANGEQFPGELYSRIFGVLKAHFDVLGKDTTQTLKMLSERADLDATAVDKVFNRETVQFDEFETLGPDDRAEFLRNIEVLIPRR